MVDNTVKFEPTTKRSRANGHLWPIMSTNASHLTRKRGIVVGLAEDFFTRFLIGDRLLWLFEGVLDDLRHKRLAAEAMLELLHLHSTSKHCTTKPHPWLRAK